MRAAHLSGEHRHTLETLSANSPEVTAERGVRTTTGGRDLPREFSARQRRRGGGILFTAHRPDGQTFHVFRPDEADPDNPGLKYEAGCKSRGAPGNALDVHPSVRHLLRDKSVPVIFVEGIKKADAILSAARREGVAVLVVAILGVWNWLSKGEPIPDMFAIPVDGRMVYICFDSDAFRNPNVGDALRRLAGHLMDRGAVVQVAYLEDQAGGSKTGADDYFAAGHSYTEFMALMRPYKPEDLAAERLKRGTRLCLMLEDLRRKFWGTEFKGMGGHSSRDVYKVLVDVAGEKGRLHAGGLRVRISRRELARLARVSTRTLQKAIERLEGMGLIYRDNAGRKAERAGAFVLVAEPRANVNQYGEGLAGPPATDTPQSELTPGGLHLRAPRLRWSSPARKGRRGLVGGTRRVRFSVVTDSRPAVKRLGKIRGAVLDALEASGGSATAAEICEALHRKRPRDLRRRVLPMLEEARLITVEGDAVTLAPDWLERLEETRELGGEIEAERLERERHKRQSEAFRNREKPLESKPSTAGLEAIRRSHEKARKHRRGNMVGWVEETTPQLSPLAAAMRDYLERNPHDARQPAGWLGSTLWTYDLYDGKPTPAESKAAIEELGGAAYLEGKLKEAKRAA